MVRNVFVNRVTKGVDLALVLRLMKTEKIAVAATASVLITFDRKALTSTSLHTEDSNYSGEERTQSSFEGMQ